MRPLRINIDKLLKRTKDRKCEYRSRSWTKNADGSLVQEGQPSYLPMDLGFVVENPDSPVAEQLQAMADEVKGKLGAGSRIWVARSGKENDVAYLVRFDHGRPETIDAYCQLPKAMVPDEDADWYEEQEQAELPPVDKDGWVSIGPGAFHVEQGTRGDVENAYSAALKSKVSLETGE